MKEVVNDKATGTSDELSTNVPDQELNLDDTIIAKLKKRSHQHILNYRQRFLEYNSQIQSPAIQRYCADKVTLH